MIIKNSNEVYCIESVWSVGNQRTVIIAIFSLLLSNNHRSCWSIDLELYLKFILYESVLSIWPQKKEHPQSWKEI
jgi:hypothetical protein